MISFNVQIRDFPFNETSQSQIESWKNNSRDYGSNWPVVYLIHNDDKREAYIGETLNAGKRAAQHWQNKERKQLKTIHIMTDDTFNKSVILDLEAFLIKYMAADGKYTLQNGNAGLANFDYYSRKEYEDEFLKIWDKLKQLGLVQNAIDDIQNTDEFKYSPYKTLTKDQEEVLGTILYIINGYLNRSLRLQTSILVEGGAGTGKTILAVYLLKLLSDLKTEIYEDDGSEESIAPEISELRAHIRERDLKVGIIIPQQALRVTLKRVFSKIFGMADARIMTPLEAAREGKDAPFDLLICDEAHRLHRRSGLSQYGSFDKTNEELGLPHDATELDWIIHSSRMQLLFYDSYQSVRPSDITPSVFHQILSRQSVYRLKLNSQLRCLGGNDYIKYLREVLELGEFGHPGLNTEGPVLRMNAFPFAYGAFQDYTLRMYDDLDEMMDEINRLDKQYGLCCAVAGYGWKWITKHESKDTSLRDIPIGRGYIWNRTNTDWINSDRLPYEIGCIHTVQGYDLNYVGVIFGPEIVYNKITGRIEVIKKNYHDNLGKAVGKNAEALRKYVLNIYFTMMTRGIHGAFVYVCDPDLREYLRPFMQS